MSQRDDGGPAFPCPRPPDQPWTDNGMTLRDWFAGQALAGLLANREWYAMAAGESHKGGPKLGELAAARALNVADAMIAAREVGR